MPVPQYMVEIAPGADLSADPSTWVWLDITGDVRTKAPINTVRGLRDEGRRADPSTMDLTINNRDGLYSPRNPSSSLFGLIRRNTPIRFRMGADILFSGFVSAWPTRWSRSGTDSWVPLKAAGILRRLQQGTPPVRSALEMAISTHARIAAFGATDPALKAYWTMEEMTNSTVSVGEFPPHHELDDAHLGDMSVALASDLSSASALGSQAIPSFPIDVLTFLDQYDLAPFEDGIWRFDCLVIIPELPTEGSGTPLRTNLVDIFTTGSLTNQHLRFRLDENGALYVEAVATAELSVSFTPTFEIVDRPILLSLVVDTATNGVTFIVSQALRGSTIVSESATGSATVAIGNPRNHSVPTGPGPLVTDAVARHIPITLGHFAISQGTEVAAGPGPILPARTALAELSPWTDLDLSALNGWDGEPAGLRLIRVAHDSGLPFELVDNPSGDEPSGPLNANPYFETDVSDWSGLNGASLSRSTDQAHDGVASMLVTPDGVTAGPQAQTEAIAVTAGQGLAASCWLRSPGTPTVAVAIRWFSDAAGTAFVSESSFFTAVTADTWTQLGKTGVAPATAISARLVVAYSGTPSAGTTLFVDEAELIGGLPDAAATRRMGPQPSATLLSTLNECPDVDGGLLFERGFGLGYRRRVDQINQTPVLKLDQGQLREAPQPTDDDKDLENHIRVEGPDGIGVVVKDQVSIGAEEMYAQSYRRNGFDLSVLRAIATDLMRVGTVDEMRWPSIVFSPSATGLVVDRLALVEGRVITLAHEWQQIPGVTPVDLIVQGWTDTITRERWITELNCVPASPWQQEESMTLIAYEEHRGKLVYTTDQGTPDELFKITGGVELEAGFNYLIVAETKAGHDGANALDVGTMAEVNIYLDADRIARSYHRPDSHFIISSPSFQQRCQVQRTGVTVGSTGTYDIGLRVRAVGMGTSDDIEIGCEVTEPFGEANWLAVYKVGPVA